MDRGASREPRAAFRILFAAYSAKAAVGSRLGSIFIASATIAEAPPTLLAQADEVIE